MKARFIVVPVLAMGVAAGAVGSVAGASAVVATRTTVTIKAEGTDLSGTVVSSKPVKCAKDRTVILIKQKGTRGGGDDVKFASDTASKQGSVFRWSTGTTGTPGRFYARIKPIDGCTGAVSPTVRAIRNP